MRPDLAHPAWRVAAGTAVGYGLLVLAVFATLFLVPYLLFGAL